MDRGVAPSRGERMRLIDDQLVHLAASQHGVFSRAQARMAGLTAQALYARTRSGSLVPVGVSALHFRGTAPGYLGVLQAGLLDLGPGALVTGRSAAYLLGLDGFGEGARDFLVPREHRGRSTPGGLVRSTSELHPLDRSPHAALPVTSATRTVVELLAIDALLAAAALGSATRLRLTHPNAVAKRLDLLGRRGRDGVKAFERLMRDGAVESWLERLFLALMRRAGLPAPAIQQRYELPSYGIARVDFEFVGYDVVVEVGGRRGYLSSEERRNQERRRSGLQLRGKTVYAFTRDDVVDTPDYVVETVRAALGIVPLFHAS